MVMKVKITIMTNHHIGAQDFKSEEYEEAKLKPCLQIQHAQNFLKCPCGWTKIDDLFVLIPITYLLDI